MKLRTHILEALGWTANRPCISHNCGSACLCPPCHARAALKKLQPDFVPVRRSRLKNRP